MSGRAQLLHWGMAAFVAPLALTNAVTAQQRIGPSFDCNSAVVANQPAAQIICNSNDLSYLELSYVISYQALRSSLDDQGRRALAVEANAHALAVTDQCNIAKYGSLGRTPRPGEVACLKRQYEQKRQDLLGRAAGAALEEAKLKPEEALAIQKALQTRAFLPPAASIDGIFGPATRSAITAWQRSVGLSATGFGSRSILDQLVGTPVVSPKAKDSIVPRAEAPIERLETPAGLLVSRKAQGPDCNGYGTGDCSTITLNGKVLFTNWYTSIGKVYPENGTPQLVVVSTHGGGNAVGASHHIIDLTQSPAIIVESSGADVNTFWRAENGVLIEQYAGRDDLGDLLIGVFSYSWGMGKLVELRKAPSYTLIPSSLKNYPEEVLADPILREPLLRIIGRDHFKDFRSRIAVQSPLKTISERYIVGNGCTPHLCGGNDGIFVLDTLQKTAWAIEREGLAGRMWGSLSANDVTPMRILGEWLRERRLSLANLTSSPSTPPLTQVPGSTNLPVFASAPRLVSSTGRVRLARTETEVRANELTPVALFEAVASTVYVIKVERPNGDRFQGSGVAVSSDYLLTNCHVVTGASSIAVTQKGISFPAMLISGNIGADRCILLADRKMDNVASIREYTSLKIGERVYSIGAPFGLELTLSDGLLSGKRTHEGVRFVQTSAPTSSGSSGGSLFDTYGNLIGITTFSLKGSQNLNFAIAAEDYVEPN